MPRQALIRRVVVMLAVCATLATAGHGAPGKLTVVRLPGNPIITPESDPSIGTNINGPSLIRVPAWVEKPLGKYYLYFADHNGKYLRLAYADRLEGPWRIHRPGTLQLAGSHFTDHIASPEAVVDDEHRRIRLYYHGLTPEERSQHTRVFRCWETGAGRSAGFLTGGSSGVQASKRRSPQVSRLAAARLTWSRCFQAPIVSLPPSV
jgi:hypothetical protein